MTSSATPLIQNRQAHYKQGVRRIQRAVLEDGCPGLLVGLSGTDSTIAFLMGYDALESLGMADRLWGMYYGRADGDTNLPLVPKMRALYEFLKIRTPQARLDVSNLTTRGLPNDDFERWADLRRMTLEKPGKNNGLWDAGQHYWSVAPRDRTEVILGNFSLDSAATSLSPIEHLYKSEILALCEDFGVPEALIDASHLPDCLCGREELAAANIELIDNILAAQNGEIMLDLSAHDPALIAQLHAHIHEKKLNNRHKLRFSGADEIPVAPSSYTPETLNAGNVRALMPEAMMALPALPEDARAKHLHLIFGMAASRPLPLSNELVECCRMAANLGFSFPIWRFLSMGLGGSAILERAGMTRLHRDTDTLDALLPEPHKDLYGPGFVHEDDTAGIEYRRAYVAIRLKGDDNFALLVRNNSPYFGRDRLPSAVLYNTDPGDMNLQDLSPRDLAQNGAWMPFERLLTDRSERGTAGIVTLTHKALTAAFAHDKKISDYLVSREGVHTLNNFLMRLQAKRPSQLFLGHIGEQSAPWSPVNVTDISEGVRTLPDVPQGMKAVLLGSPAGERPYKP